MNKDRTKVGMVQINNSFSGQNYLPLSLGFLHSFARTHAPNFADFEFPLPVYRRVPVDLAVEQLSGSDMACFSTYVWNFELSSAIARRLKEEKPETINVFGGCHIPDTREKGLEAFLRERPFIDMAAIGEGEITFASLLQNYPTRSWNSVPSLAFIDSKGNFVMTPPAPRIEDLNEVPSPYLSGYFDSLMAANPNENWIGLFETNRGCPFKCTFCDWGTGAKNRMANYDLEGRLFDEIKWFSDKKVGFVYCCDANFGMYKDRDLAIAQKFAEMKAATGFPERFSVQNTKNSTDSSYDIQRVLVESGLDKGVLLAFQSLHGPTLKAIERRNIKLETFFELQRRFTSDGITTFSDIILGLPLETYETFTRGVSELIERGQHNRIQFNNLSILPNSPIVEDIERYGLDVVDTKIINIHGSLSETEEIEESQRLVIGSNTMPRGDWARSRAFGYMTSLLHFDKLLQIPNMLLNLRHGVPYNEIVDTFLRADSASLPVISAISTAFMDKARDIQNGGAEYSESKRWLNIWWPADELAYIEMATRGKLPEFYDEAQEIFQDLLRREGQFDDGALEEAILFNKALLKQPFNYNEVVIKLNYDIPRFYRLGLVGEKPELIRGQFSYTIEKEKESWDSWEEWCQKVVWYGNKKGDYLYSSHEKITPIPEAVSS